MVIKGYLWIHLDASIAVSSSLEFLFFFYRGKFKCRYGWNGRHRQSCFLGSSARVEPSTASTNCGLHKKKNNEKEKSSAKPKVVLSSGLVGFLATLWTRLESSIHLEVGNLVALLKQVSTLLISFSGITNTFARCTK